MNDRSVETLSRLPVVRAALLLAWKRPLLPVPKGIVTTRLRDGRAFRCNMSDHTQRKMALGCFEPMETALVRDTLKKGDTFVDVGAHIGWFTTLAAQLVGPEGRVFAFEPFPSTFELLVANVELNNLENVETFPVAMSAQAGAASVGIQTGSDSGSATAGVRAAVGVIRVEAAALDDILPNACAPDMLKIDVEGLEGRVLEGAEATLKSTKTVLIELNSSALSANGSDASHIRSFLADRGFTFQRLLTLPLHLRLKMRLERSQADQPPWANLLAVRE